MLIGRIPGILLFAIIFGIWTLIPLGLHWFAMTFWILVQKTTFCPNKLEETLYNVVMGFVYCFCYINLREGHTRYRLMLFYTLMVSQNFGSLFLYVLISETEQQKKPWSIAAAICILFGTIVGILSMILYYRYFHSTGPISWKTDDIELNNKVVVQESNNKKGGSLNHVRSFKSAKKNEETEATSSKDKDVTTEQAQKQESENADKKFLLEHWIARSGSPTFTSAPIGNSSLEASSIEFYTVENTPQLVLQDDEYKPKNNKKRAICSPTELTLKLNSMENLESSIDEITSSNLNLHKRRGICSSDALRDDLTNINLEVCNLVNEEFMKMLKTDSSEISHDTDGSNKKTSSDSIDMDLDLSFSDINSSDINTFNENIVQKLCLSALKNIKVGNQDADIENIQRIALDILKEMYAKKDKNKNGIGTDLFPSKPRELDTPTEILSVHDYENICAVNIAREAWGLRSWNGYSDIENWLHDGSVVRDRRRDTLTSGSSEISSCISQDLKNAILAAPPFPKKPHTYSNVFVKFDRTNQDDYANTLVSHDDTFLAKPCMTDISKDPNHLEPIMEELDDLGDIDPSNKKRLNSESSLVATIDEIRKSTVTNSPRNLYHRREHLWDSPQFNTSTKIDLKQALWKEPSKFDPSNIMESLPEKENCMNIVERSKYVMIKKELNVSNISSSSTDLHGGENASVYNKNTRRRQKTNSTNIKLQSKKINIKPEQNEHDLSNKDIDFLWQLVSESSAPNNSSEDCSSNKISTSLQSLIQKDATMPVVNTSTSKLSNVKKGARSRPRRKFSILRERFEPRINLNSDEEILYRSCEISQPQSDSSVIHVKNQFDAEHGGRTVPRKQNYDNLSFETSESLPNAAVSCDLVMSKNIKEKRSLFMKQVLSPPKFNTKLRHKV
uniref:XK-related protein n=1 Tax=Heliothis virescens TaxID=7102 RepID=A0A2A4K696_HELVI